MIEIGPGPNSSLLLRPTGDLDWFGATSLRHAVADCLAERVQFVIDLRRVKYIDAVGISALLGTLRRARAVGGEVRVVNPRPAVRHRLQLAGVYPSLMDAFSNNGDDAA